MIHTYSLKGMSCGGCKASVEKYLGQVDGVTSVTANLQNAEAELTMSSHIHIETLQSALPSKYVISEKKINIS